MRIKLTVLSPIHIGSGEEISPTEYFIDGNKFIRIDMNGLFNDSRFGGYFESFISNAKNQRYLGDLVKNRDLLLHYPLYSFNLSPGVDNLKNKIAVKAFVKSAGRVYIPGSSLKGSLLSAIIWKKGKEAKIKDIKDLTSILDIIIGNISNRPLNNKFKFSRWLDVSDSELKFPSEVLELSLIKVENLLVAQRKIQSIPVLCETLKRGITFETEFKSCLVYDGKIIDEFGKLSELDILKACHEFYSKIYEKEKYFGNQKLKLPDLPSNLDYFLVRLGQGSTCLSTSLLILAEGLGINNYEVKRPPIKGRHLPPIKPGEFPRTKKLVQNQPKGLSMGWAKIEKIE